jgi:hypothetical protein
MRTALCKVEEAMIKQRLDKHDYRWDIWRVTEEAYRVLVKEIVI